MMMLNHCDSHAWSKLVSCADVIRVNYGHMQKDL